MIAKRNLFRNAGAAIVSLRDRAAASIFLVLLSSMISMALGAAVFLIGAQTTPESSAFIRMPETITWVCVNEVLFALYPLSGIFLWRLYQQFKPQLSQSKMELLVASALAFVVYMLPSVVGGLVVTTRPSVYEYAQIRVFIVESVAFLAGALPFALGMWLVQISLREKFKDSKDTKSSKDEIKEYIGLRDYLQYSLLGMGVLLSIGILASAALRKAAIASGTTTVADYPQIYLLVIGSYYTLTTALLYLPAYMALASAGRWVLEQCFALPDPDQSWAKAYETRKAFEDYLELKVSGEQRLVTNLTILAPFVGSIFTLLVG
jgi:hypothetical protein